MEWEKAERPKILLFSLQKDSLMDVIDLQANVLANTKHKNLEGLTPSYDSTTLRSQLHQMQGLPWRGGAEYVTQEKSIGKHSIQPWVPDSNS